MDSNPTPTPTPTQAVKTSAGPSKLPIKRKATDPNPPSPMSIPDTILNPHPNCLPPIPTSLTHFENSSGPDSKPPPFKFHRIWTEPDEIRFLQGLLDSGSQNLFFPRDLSTFYMRFSSTMMRPYTKSQLSEKLRRLRRKFRVISTRLSKGLDISFLSTHDRALYDISKQLWHTDYAETSPFFSGSNDKAKETDLIGVEVSFLPELASGLDHIVTDNFEFNWETNDNGEDDHVFGNVGWNDLAKLSEVNVESDKEEEMARKKGEGIGVGEVAAAKAVIDVFDESLEEVKLGILNEGLSGNVCEEEEEGKKLDFDRLWRKQRLAEFDVLARRMRLVFKRSLVQRGDEGIVQLYMD